MKLTIEEKAKRYDEAIEIARKIKNGEPINVPNGTVIPDVIFPELKENRDERIRKGLLDYFKEIIEPDGDDSEAYYAGMKIKDIIAWLERQGEQKPVEWSEYDEHKIKNIIYFLESAKKHYISDVEIDACVRWLWSLLQSMG